MHFHYKSISFALHVFLGMCVHVCVHARMHVCVHVCVCVSFHSLQLCVSMPKGKFSCMETAVDKVLALRVIVHMCVCECTCRLVCHRCEQHSY